MADGDESGIATVYKVVSQVLQENEGVNTKAAAALGLPEGFRVLAYDETGSGKKRVEFRTPDGKRARGLGKLKESLGYIPEPFLQLLPKSMAGTLGNDENVVSLEEAYAVASEALRVNGGQSQLAAESVGLPEGFRINVIQEESGAKRKRVRFVDGQGCRFWWPFSQFNASFGYIPKSFLKRTAKIKMKAESEIVVNALKAKEMDPAAAAESLGLPKGFQATVQLSGEEGNVSDSPDKGSSVSSLPRSSGIAKEKAYKAIQDSLAEYGSPEQAATALGLPAGYKVSAYPGGSRFRITTADGTRVESIPKLEQILGNLPDCLKDRIGGDDVAREIPRQRPTQEAARGRLLRTDLDVAQVRGVKYVSATGEIYYSFQALQAAIGFVPEGFKSAAPEAAEALPKVQDSVIPEPKKNHRRPQKTLQVAKDERLQKIGPKQQTAASGKVKKGMRARVDISQREGKVTTVKTSPKRKRDQLGGPGEKKAAQSSSKGVSSTSSSSDSDNIPDGTHAASTATSSAAQRADAKSSSSSSSSSSDSSSDSEDEGAAPVPAEAATARAVNAMPLAVSMTPSAQSSSAPVAARVSSEADDIPLPPGWVAGWSSEYEIQFWWNEETEESVWERPLK